MGKRQPLIIINENLPHFRSVKMDRTNNPSDRFPEPAPKRPRTARTGGGGEAREEPVEQTAADRRVLRSHYLVVKNLIHEEKEELCKGESDRFQKIIKEVDRLHEHVTKPREQVTDAETLLEMANTLVTTVKAYSKEGITPSDFISSMICEFGNAGRRRTENDQVTVNWNAIGVLVCPILKKGYGCCTMIGPMNTQLKQRKVMAPRRRTKPTERAAKPEQLEDSGADEKTDTDRNMATMFDILRRKKTARLEHLLLNRFSFAQTVENLFALSFLIKDGRAKVAVDEKGTHTVSPKNAPPSSLVASGEVVYDHFVFRFDFKDWKLMADSVPGGEELMPHRYQVSIPLSQSDTVPIDSQLAIPTSPMNR